MATLTVLARYEPGPSQPYPRVRLSDGRIIREHRWVMEQHLRRRLRTDEHVHHDDEVPTNNELSNLKLTTRSEHTRLHSKPAPQTKLTCPKCGDGFSRPTRDVRYRRKHGQKEIFCSRSCSRQGRHVGKELFVGSYFCDVCGDRFVLSPSQYRLRKKRNQSGKVACSRACGQSLRRQCVRGVQQ